MKGILLPAEHLGHELRIFVFIFLPTQNSRTLRQIPVQFYKSLTVEKQKLPQ